MTPQELVADLLLMNEKEGRQLLQRHIFTFDDASIAFLVELIKREADRQWNNDGQVSFTLAGYLLAIGDLTFNKASHALGLMARGDALRRMDRDKEALPYFDASGEEFKEIGDEVGWARTRIGRISACLQLNRTNQALRLFDRAIETYSLQGEGVELNIARARGNKAITLAAQGKFREAVALHEHARTT